MQTEFEYSGQLNSVLDEVDTQVKNLLLALDQHLDKYHRFALDLVMRETLNNAVIHGNQRQPDQLVNYSVKVAGQQFEIMVSDEGTGFDWRSVLNLESVKGYDHGRGFPILQSYCSHIRLNEAGNQIFFSMNITKDE